MTSTNRPRPRGGSILVAFLAAACFLAATRATARVLLTQDEALRIALGGDAEIARRTAFLSETQLRRAQELAGPGVDVKSALVVWYEPKDGQLRRRAYFDTHRVRTLQESVIVVVEPDGTIGRIEVLSFGEPPEYLPKKSWLAQLVGRGLDPELAVERGIRGITGATLSSRAVTDAARRVLAVDRVLHETPGAPRGGEVRAP